MSFFVKSTPATTPKTKNIRPISVGLAAVLIIMVVAQLFTFETFADVISSMGLPGGNDISPIRAAVIVALEVASVPFLLSMRLSLAMRFVSMVAGWISVAAWLFVSLWINISGNIPKSSGLLGDTVTAPVGWWSVLFCLGLGVLAAWTAWGMWPVMRRAKRK